MNIRKIKTKILVLSSTHSLFNTSGNFRKCSNCFFSDNCSWLCSLFCRLCLQLGIGHQASIKLSGRCIPKLFFTPAEYGLCGYKIFYPFVIFFFIFLSGFFLERSSTSIFLKILGGIIGARKAAITGSFTSCHNPGCCLSCSSISKISSVE